MTTADPKTIIKTLERTLGHEHVSDNVEAHSIDSLMPKAVVFPNSLHQLSQVMNVAWKSNMIVAPWGGGTRTHLGNNIRHLDIVVNLSRMNRVVTHSPGDLTTTVEAGTSIAHLRHVLSQKGQFLALDPPMPHLATVGGTLAAGVSGPLKWHYRHPRDLVIGMKVVQSNGKITKSGGQVVKNVSGYDMAKLHIGGLGTLGIIAQVSFKLTPLPPKEVTLTATFETSNQALRAGIDTFQSQIMPLALTFFDGNVNWHTKLIQPNGKYFLAIRLGGRPRAIERQVNDYYSLCQNNGATSLDKIDESSSDNFWQNLADFGWDESIKPIVVGRVSLLPSRIADLTKAFKNLKHSNDLHPAILAHPGYGNIMINWFAEYEDLDFENITRLLSEARDTVHRLKGRMIIERCPSEIKAQFDVWDNLGESLFIMRSMKEQYDPKGILNPGRFAGGI